jgi:hypothetical protein
MDASALVAAAAQAGDDPFLGALKLANIADRVQFQLNLRDESVKFVGTPVRVDRIKTENGWAGKCHVGYRAARESQYADGDGLEWIETDWLSDPIAAYIEQELESHPGDRFLFWKHNAEDPSGKVSHGFRRVIWVQHLGAGLEDQQEPSQGRSSLRQPAESTSGSVGASTKQLDLLKSLCTEVCFPADKKKFLPALGIDGRLEDLSKSEASSFIDLVTELKKNTTSLDGWMRTAAGQWMVADGSEPF